MGPGPRQGGGGLGATRSTSSGRTPRASAMPWARFSAWLECVCVVTFDLELGQALEVSGWAGRPSRTVPVPSPSAARASPDAPPLRTSLLSRCPSPPRSSLPLARTPAAALFLPVLALRCAPTLQEADPMASSPAAFLLGLGSSSSPLCILCILGLTFIPLPSTSD